MNAAIAIAPLAPEHFAQVHCLSDALFGPGYLADDALPSIVARSTPTDGSAPLSSVALQGGHVVAVNLVVLPGTWTTETEGVPAFPELWPCTPAVAAGTAYHVAILVDPAFAGVGIGSSLFRAAARDLAAAGVRGLVAHVWRASASAVALSRRMRGAEVRVAPAAWGEWALSAGYACPECSGPGGPPGCACDALEVFYALPLQEGAGAAGSSGT